MNAREEAAYRLELARGHLESAEKLFEMALWSESAHSSQLSVENSAKTVISVFRPIVKTHDVVPALLDVEDEFEAEEDRRAIERLASLAQRLGLKEHILVSYGDEVAHKTPWELYDEEKARRTLDMAQEAFRIAQALLKWETYEH
jgi:HEPN domain-containing protein